MSIMTIVRQDVNGNEYMFINSSRGNRSGFVHETELQRNGMVLGENKIQYYNRTWERYTYESVMKGLVRELMNECFEAYKTAWKNEHEVKRLTEEKRKLMQKDLQADPPKNYAELAELYKML